MTALFVFSMIVVLVGAQLALSAHRGRVARRASAAIKYVEAGRASRPAEDVLFHPGHSWVQLHDEKLASVGASAFASNFAGDIAQVRTPPPGAQLRQAERACTLVSRSGRQLDVPMPIDGQVLAINESLRRDPGLMQERPYDRGWILRVKPRRAERGVRNLAPAAAAQRWMDSARGVLAAHDSGPTAALAFDGGEWARGFGEHLDDADWNTLREQLFPRINRPDEARAEAR